MNWLLKRLPAVRPARSALAGAATLWVLGFCLSVLLTSRVAAGEPATATTSGVSPGAGGASAAAQRLAGEIDAAIAASQRAAGIEPGAVVEDAGFARRVTLDLAGRIPTTAELQAFLDDPAPGKRRRLIERLLTTADYAFHQRNQLDLLLLARLRRDGAWRDYLLQASRERRPWDQLLREILLPEREQPDEAGAAAFLRHRAKDLDALTNDTSSLLFGINIACAKCHDHPLVVDWEQRHYFGMASFFKRTYTTRGGSVAERFEGDVRFTTIYGEEKDASFMFLSGARVEEPAVERSDAEWKQVRQQIKEAEKNDQADPPPLPAFSPRAQLVDLALEDPRRYLAKNVANRLWARLLGRGLVDPLDQMHSENPPSHPALLERLAEELVAHDYQLSHLVRAIMISDTYARSSRLADAEPPPPEAFAVALPRPLTPHQLALSLSLATRDPAALPGPAKPSDWEQQRAAWEQRAEGWARRFEIPSPRFQVPVEEAMLLSNGTEMQQDLLADRSDRLVGALQKQPSVPEQIDRAFRAILSRPAEPAERERLAAYLEARRDRPVAGLRQMVWALLTSAEFRFNH